MGIYEQIKLLSPDTMAEIHEKATLWGSTMRNID